MKVLASTIGDPFSVKTYSGVPFHLFGEMERRSLLAGRINSYRIELADYVRGLIDIRRSLRSFRLQKNSLWRYKVDNIEMLSNRIKHDCDMLDFDTFFQIGVGALPKNDSKIISYVEIPVMMAIQSKWFSKTYGFSGHGKALENSALEGERYYLSRNDLIWTSSSWTAQKIVDAGANPNKIFIHPPAVAVDDPGKVTRDWSKKNILFVGRKWGSKGGPLLLSAFQKVKKLFPDATLTIIGCNPKVSGDGVRILGFLNKNIASEFSLLKRAYEDATLFCMPSYWESVGIVYFEAALYGLPVVMLAGQGREEIFDSFGLIVHDPSTKCLAESIIGLFEDSDLAKSMGAIGRETVLSKYMYPTLVDTLIAEIKKA